MPARNYFHFILLLGCLAFMACHSKAKLCDVCKGKGTVMCAPCDGHGKIDCTWCEGAGSKRCTDCAGKGKKQIDDYKYVHERGGMVYKNVTRTIPCDKCHQKGCTACAECNSTGKKECPGCHGSGNNACSNCLGKGHITKEWRLVGGR